MESRKLKKGIICLPLAILCAACIPFDSIDVYRAAIEYHGATDLQYFWLNSVIYGGIFGAYFMLILAAIPFSDQFCREYQGGTWRYLIARSGRIKYTLRHFSITFLGSGLVAAGGGLIFLVFSSLYCSLFDENRYIEVVVFPYTALLKDSAVLYFVVMLYLLFLSAGISACIALAFSVFVPQRYLVYLMPFIFKFFLTRACTLFRIPIEWRIDFWMSARSGPFGVTGNLLLTTSSIILLFVICILLFDKKLKWRIEHE